jgi:4-carboxymuconolactone decarboxylase
MVALRAVVGDDKAREYVAAGPAGPHPPHAFTTLARNPRVAEALFRFHRAVARESSLPSRIRELAVLRVAMRTGSRYQWAQHVRLAGTAAVTESEIDALAEAAVAPAWARQERVVLLAVDQLIDSRDIKDSTWVELSTMFDDAVLIELILLVGFHVCTAMILRTLRVELDPDLAAVQLPADLSVSR